MPAGSSSVFFRVVLVPSYDSDGDGLDDYEEFLLGTNPYSADTDGDGLTDIQEFQGFMVNGQVVTTNPTNPDSDGDGVADGAEVASGKNPMDASDGFPLSPEQRPVRLRMQFRGTWPDYTTPGPPNLPMLLLSAGSGATLGQGEVNTASAFAGGPYFGNTGTTYPDRSLTRGVEYPLTLTFAGAVGVWPTVVGRVWGSPLNAAADRANLIVFQTGKGYYFTNDGGGIWPEANWQTTGNGTIGNIPDQQLEARNFNTGRLWAVTFDLDIDSLNARGSEPPLRSTAEEDAEETQAKRVPINLDDDNHNGIPDAQETTVAGEKSLIPVILEVAPQTLEWDKIKIKINSDAAAAEVNLWRLNRPGDPKTADRKITPGTTYTAAQLGLGATLPGGGKQTQLKFFIEGLALTNGNRYLEAVFIFNNTTEREYFKDRVLFAVVPEVEIVVDLGASSRPDAPTDATGIGGTVPSNKGSSGEKHFVSPKEAGGFVVFRTNIAPSGTNFDDTFKWDPAVGVAVAGDPAARKVPRDATGKFTLRVLRKSDDSEADRLNVWIVWATGTITHNPQTTFFRETDNVQVYTIDNTQALSAAVFKMTDRILMKFTVEPTSPASQSILDTGADIPDLTGTVDLLSGIPGSGKPAISPPGTSLLDNGADARWDVSRRVQVDVRNPSAIPRGKFDKGQALAIRTNPPTGVQAPFPASDPFYDNDPLVGNDDFDARTQNNNPYAAFSNPADTSLNHGIGELTSRDKVELVMPEAGIPEGAELDINLRAQEFVRLQIGSSWFIISDPLPWKMQMKMKFQGGAFIDMGSSYSLGN